MGGEIAIPLRPEGGRHRDKVLVGATCMSQFRCIDTYTTQKCRALVHTITGTYYTESALLYTHEGSSLVVWSSYCTGQSQDSRLKCL